MKVIRCPACGQMNRNQKSKHCVSCGCYLPPLLEEEIMDNYTYVSTPYSDTNATAMYNNLRSIVNVYTQSELTNVADTLNYEMEKLRSQINADYRKLSQSMQTQYLINSFSARDEYGRVMATKDLTKYQKMPTKNHYD